jgi:hypothetical protein
MAIIQSGATSDLLTIDTTSKAARASLYNTAGFPMAVSDAQNISLGTQTGFPMAGASDNTYRVLRTDRIGNIRTGQDALLLHDDVEGTTLNTQLWTSSVGTMTITQVVGQGITFNAGNSVASGVYAILTSQKQFSKMQAAPLRVRFRVKFVPTNNTIGEMGFCAPVTTTGQIATGAFFRATTTGTIVPVLAFNGADVVQGTDISAAIGAIAGGFNNYFTCGIWVDDDSVLFTVQDVSTGQSIAEQTLQIPRNQAKTFSATHIPFALRLYTTGVPTVAPQIFLSDIMIIGLDILQNKPWSHQLAGTSNGSEINPTTFLQSSNWTNSTVATNAVLSNTAAGYTTLGGLFSFAAVAGAVTDYALFGFTVPAPYTFYCTGIRISSYNTGAAVATSATLLHWGVANNSPAVSLATAGLNRVAVGAQAFPIASAIGAVATDLYLKFDAPLVTNGGRIMHVILRMPVGTATASQVVQGSVTLFGYFE